MSEEFKKTIDDALLTAKTGGHRFVQRDSQRAKHAMEIFENDPSLEIPTVIPQLIGSYLIDESPRSRAASKEQDDDELGEGISDVFEAFEYIRKGVPRVC